MTTNREKGMALITAMLVLVLISAIIIGFSWAVMTDQTMGGATNQRQKAFYAAEAGMEQLTANLNNLFGQNYSPSGAQINALAGVANEPNIPGTTFIDPAKGTPGSGYSISFTADKNGDPTAVNDTITSGPYQGMQGLVTPYTLNVIAQGTTGGEVKLQRVVQTVGIPLYQFGIFSQTDLSFYAGPAFDFGGRVHTNGNLYLAEGNGNTLTLDDKVTAVGEVIRTNLSNGWLTSTNYTGTVDVLTAPGTYRALATTEGSLVGTLGSAENSTWQSISISTYNSYIRNGDLDLPTYTGTNGTGVSTLNLEVATPLIGGTPIDLIRRPVQNEDTTNSGKLGERYFSASKPSHPAFGQRGRHCESAVRDGQRPGGPEPVGTDGSPNKGGCVGHESDIGGHRDSSERAWRRRCEPAPPRSIRGCKYHIYSGFFHRGWLLGAKRHTNHQGIHQDRGADILWGPVWDVQGCDC